LNHVEKSGEFLKFLNFELFFSKTSLNQKKIKSKVSPKKKKKKAFGKLLGACFMLTWNVHFF
jgi:hypothetical protein